MKESGLRLIVTADDFGLSPLINSAVIQAHREGILTSASLMVNGAAFEEAVLLAKENPNLGVGIHITLVRGRATLSPNELFPLVNRKGCFSDNPFAVGLRYFVRKEARPLLQKEIEAQIQRFYSTGLTPSHIDGHLHFHMHPTILGIIVRLAEKYAIPACRVPKDRLILNLKDDTQSLGLKFLYFLIYSCLCAYAEKKLRSSRVLFPDRFFGLLASGHMIESHLLRIIENMEPGITEIGMHPALALPPELERWAPRYEYENELKALISPRVRESIRARNIQLTNYGSLGRHPCR